MRAAEAGDDEGWVAPEPAEEVIVEEILAATDLSREDIEPLTEHVDFEQLATLLSGEGTDEPTTFSVEGHEITVSADGDVTITDAE